MANYLDFDSSLNSQKNMLRSWLNLLWNLTPPLFDSTSHNEEYLLLNKFEILEVPKILSNGISFPSKIYSQNEFEFFLKKFNKKEIKNKLLCFSQISSPGIKNILHQEFKNISFSNLWYRAAVSHAAAHLIYSNNRYSTNGVPPITQILLGVLEDARIEILASNEYPGLKRLWLSWHKFEMNQDTSNNTSLNSLFQRLSLSLIDASYVDSHEWVKKGKKLFDERMNLHKNFLHEPIELRKLASELGNDLGQMRATINPRNYRPRPFYRDDNNWLWYQESKDQEAQTLKSSFTIQSEEDIEKQKETNIFSYPEWDFKIMRLRNDWCLLYEFFASEKKVIKKFEQRVSSKLIHALKNLSKSSHSREFTKHNEGDILNLDAAVQLKAFLSNNKYTYDTNIFLKQIEFTKTALYILIDQSTSTKEYIFNGDAKKTILDTNKEIASALMLAANKISWNISIAGFCSDGRRSVQISKVKDFNDLINNNVFNRLFGLESQYSTRLGTAIRHASKKLTECSENNKLLIVLSDSELHDIDIYEQDYLLLDAKEALKQARFKNIKSICLCAGMENQNTQLNRLWGYKQWSYANNPENLQQSMKILS